MEALTANWWRARDVFMPNGPTTRDERYVWEALRRARTEDIWALEGKSPALVVPCDPGKQWNNIEPSERIKMQEGDTVRYQGPDRFTGQPKMAPELMTAWLDFHPEWVKHETARVIAEAFEKLRQAKRDRRAVIRNSRRLLGPRGKRRWVKPRGRPPELRIKVGRDNRKVGNTKPQAKKVVSA